MPQLPTMAESGFAGFDMTAWFGLLAPAGTPPQVVSRMSDALLKGLRSADARQRISAVGAEPGHFTPTEFAAYIRAENARWRKLFSDRALRLDE